MNWAGNLALRKRMVFTQAKKKFRSESQTCEAIREYSPEAEKNVDEKQATLREVEGRLLSAGTEGARCAKRFKDSVADVSCIIAVLSGLKTESQGKPNTSHPIEMATFEQLQFRGCVTR